jgi:hypothetical protein
MYYVIYNNAQLKKIILSDEAEFLKWDQKQSQGFRNKNQNDAGEDVLTAFQQN